MEKQASEENKNRGVIFEILKQKKSEIKTLIVFIPPTAKRTYTSAEKLFFSEVQKCT